MVVSVSALRRGVHVCHVPTGRHGIVQGPDQRYFPDPVDVFVHFRWNGDRLGLVPVCELEIVQESGERAVVAHAGAGRVVGCDGCDPALCGPEGRVVWSSAPSLDQPPAAPASVDVSASLFAAAQRAAVP